MEIVRGLMVMIIYSYYPGYLLGIEDANVCQENTL